MIAGISNILNMFAIDKSCIKTKTNTVAEGGQCWSKILKMYLFQSSQCRGCRLFRRLAFHTIEYDYFPWIYAIRFTSALIWWFFFAFRALNAEVVACSVDSHFTQLAWTNVPRKEGGLGPLNIPLLADITHKISKDYGVYLEDNGHSLRGLFIIDDKGKGPSIYYVCLYRGGGRVGVTGQKDLQSLRGLHAEQDSET